MKRIWFVALLMAVTSLLTASVALAQVPPGDTSQTPTQVNTSAVINPAGQPPVVEWKWELPDMDSHTPGIQYFDTSGNSDDDPVLKPVIVTNPNGVNHMMQVAPNPEDLPAKRLIEYWMAVEDPNGTANIGLPFFIVYHPDGSFKYKIHAGGTEGEKVACSVIGTVDATGKPTGYGDPIKAALNTGQMTAAEAALMVEKCYKNEKAIYRAWGDISKEQPAGEYRVEATAVDAQGNTATMVNWFDVLSIVALRIDFSALDFGQILPNTPSWLSGDRVFNPSNDSAPTIKNVGNDPMYTHVAFTRMKGAQYSNYVEIFDARLGTTELPPFNAESPIGVLNWQCFPNKVLGANEIGQLDLSIHPGSLPGDTYTGKFHIVGKHSCP